MNRAERRKLGKGKEKEPVYMLTQSQIMDIKKVTIDSAIDKAFVLMLGLPIMAINKDFGKLIKKDLAGLSREERFTNLVLNLYDSFNKGEFTFDDIKTNIKERCGIDITEIQNSKRFI